MVKTFVTPKKTGRTTSNIVELNPADHVDYPRFAGGDQSSADARRKRGPKMEMAWTRELMAASADWYDVIGIPEICTYQLERSVRPFLAGIGAQLNAGVSAQLGLPRMDAVGHHTDGTLSIIEAKLECSVVEMLRGVAQLLYYKTLMTSLEQATVAHLILASPSWPAYVIETICEYKLPIRLLKVDDVGIAVSIPQHLQQESRDAQGQAAN